MPCISRPEDALIKRALGNFQYPLAMTVAKLYLSDGKGMNAIWHETGIWGAVVLTIDREDESLPHLIKILDMGNFKTLFCQEIYEMLNYRMSQQDFHCFEIQGKIVGLRFADAAEAKSFSTKVKSRLGKLAEDMNKRRTSARDSKGGGMFEKFRGWFGGKKKQDEKEPVIGRPSDFKHEAHIGFDPEKGFDLNSLSPRLKRMFKSAGIRKKHLRNPTCGNFLNFHLIPTV